VRESGEESALDKESIILIQPTKFHALDDDNYKPIQKQYRKSSIQKTHITCREDGTIETKHACNSSKLVSNSSPHFLFSII